VKIGAVLNGYTYRSRQTDRAQIVKACLDAPPAGRDWIKGEEMIATSHGRRSWKDSPTAKAIAATISLLLITGLIAIYAVKLP